MKKLCAIVICLFILNSCTRPCEDLKGLESSAMLIYPFNLSLNDYFYPQDEFRSIFKKDSLQVINEDGKVFTNVTFILAADPRAPLNNIYAVKVAPAFIIPDDNSAFSTEKIRKIYLKYNYNTVDTLTLVFKAKKTKCDRSTYEYLRVYHRNKLIQSVANDNGTDFPLNH